MKLRIACFSLISVLAVARCFAADDNPERWKKMKGFQGSFAISSFSSTKDNLGGPESIRTVSFKATGTLDLKRTSVDEYWEEVVFEGSFSGSTNFTGSSDTNIDLFGLDSSAKCQGPVNKDSQAKLTIKYKTQKYYLEVSGGTKCSSSKITVSASDIKEEMEMSPDFSFSAFLTMDDLQEGGLQLPKTGKVIQKSSKMMVAVGSGAMVPPFNADANWRISAEKKKVKVKAAPNPVTFKNDSRENQVGGVVCPGGYFMPNKSWASNDTENFKADDKDPEVTIEYNEEQDEWLIKSIVIYSIMEIRLPDKDSYPENDKNVVDSPQLSPQGARYPKDDPKGKGHWSNVVQNLCAYGKTGDWQIKLQWCVKDATKFHEEKHRELFEKTFLVMWENAYEKALIAELETYIENQDPPEDGIKKKIIDFLVQKIKERPDTNEAVDELTKERYEEKAREIFNRFNKDKGKTFQCGNSE